ncbi:MAG: dicarboxylate/amino acid:cation symporter [Verrucomicrobiota bacterium]
MKAILRSPLWLQILVAIALAGLTGYLIGPQSPFDLAGSVFAANTIWWLDYIGDLFLQALKMIVVPLIAAAVITAVANMGKEHAFGRLGLKVIGLYALTTLFSVCTGLFFVNVIQPGDVPESVANALQGQSMSPEELEATVGQSTEEDIWGIFKRMIPANVLAAGSDNRALLALIVFCILFGFFLGQATQNDGVRAVRAAFDGLYEIMLRITDFVMKFAPIGVFGLVGETAAQVELQQLWSLVAYFFTVVASLGFHLFVTLPVLLVVIGRVKPWRHFAAMFPALLTAFSTSSSSATLPLTLECLQERAKVSPRVSNFTCPLGATINMDGTALYECVVVVFLAQVWGLELTLAQQFLVVILALLTSVGVAGVPSASLVAIVVILAAVGLPAEGIGIIFVFDRILDMMRTAVNVFSDSVVAVLVARTEGETDVLAQTVPAKA